MSKGATKTYHTTGPVLLGDEMLEIGTDVELTSKDAKPLLAAGFIKEGTAPKATPEKPAK